MYLQSKTSECKESFFYHLESILKHLHLKFQSFCASQVQSLVVPVGRETYSTCRDFQFIIIIVTAYQPCQCNTEILAGRYDMKYELVCAKCNASFLKPRNYLSLARLKYALFSSLDRIRPSW